MDFKEIENNLFSKFLYLPKILGYEVIENKENILINSGFNSSMFNIVCATRFSEENYKKQVAKIINHFNGKPFAWWLGPSSLPKGLGKYLLELSFIKETNEYAMLCDLEDYISPIKSIAARVELATTKKHLEHIAKIMGFYDDNAKIFYNNSDILEDKVQEKNPLFIAYLDNQPVATGELHFNKNLAGIFGLITNKEHRGKGIGSAMIHYLINYAKGNGIKQICLSASSDEGFSLYKKFGFNTIGMYECFEHLGKV